MLLSYSFAVGQCVNPSPDILCPDDTAGLQPETFDLTLACETLSSQTIDSLGAGGLYAIQVSAGRSYRFTLTPLDSDVQNGQMELFTDILQTNLVASSGLSGASTSTTSELSYTHGANAVLYLAVWRHKCVGDWSRFSLTVECTDCDITCVNRVRIDANEDGCVAAASTFNAPTTSGPCDTIVITDDGGTGAMIDNNTNLVSIMPGLATGEYTIQFAVMNCAGGLVDTSPCSTDVVVKPTSGCNYSVNTQFNDEFCSVTLTPSLLLKTECASPEDYTFFIDGIPVTSLTEAGSYEVSVSYTPQSNSSISEPLCWGTINVEDKSGPTCTLSDTEYNFVCGFEGAVDPATYTDCSGTVTANDVVELTIGNCGELDGFTDGDNDLFNDLPITTMGVTIPVPTEAEAVLLNADSFALEKVLVNIYSASDGNFSGNSCEQFIYIFRPTDIIAPGTALITCGLDTSPSDLAAIDPKLVPYYENPLYGDDNSTMNDFSGMGVEDAAFMPTRVDDAGNPEFVAIAGQDHTVCAFTVTSEDRPITSPCGMTQKFIRDYTVLDCCTSEILLNNVAQYIETKDTVAPEFMNCPTGMEVGALMNPDTINIDSSFLCSAIVDINSFGLQATDVCSGPVTFSASFVSLGSISSGSGTVVATGVTRASLDKGDYRVAVTARDECNNTSSRCNYFININDNVAPTVSCKRPAYSVDGNGNAQVCAIDNANASDNCGIIANLEVKLMEQGDETFAPCINVNCTDAVEDSLGVMVFNLVYRATDACGNTNISMCPSELQIKTTPNFTCPADSTIECSVYSQTTNYGDPNVGGLCGQMFTTRFKDADLVVGACPGTGTIDRTHFVVLNGVDQDSCTQTLIIEDNTDPTFNNRPDDVTVECDNLPDGTMVTASDECNTATVDFEDDRMDGMCADSYILTRTFTATDACGNDTTATQTITVEDTTAPEFTDTPNDATVACGNLPPIEPARAMDNCDDNVDITVAQSDTTGLSEALTCPDDVTVTRTYTATDNCGNDTSFVQTITLQYVPAMVMFIGPDTLDCGALDTFMFTPPTITESPCGDSNIDVSDVTIVSDTLDNGNILLSGSYTVTNDCDLDVTGTTQVLFTNCCPSLDIDITSFTSTCVNGTGSVTAMFSTNLPNDSVVLRLVRTSDDFILATQDGNNPTFSISQAPGTVQGYDLEAFTLGNEPAEDCPIESQFIGFGCSNRSISGRIFNEEFIPLEEVEVELMNTEIPMSMTDENGEYSFEGLGEQAYTIAAHKEKDPFNGISTYDLVVMAQHVLGIQDLDSPYKLIAADINMDETIDILDMLELRQLILYSIADFSVNTSWRFVNANYIFPDPTNPWLETIPEIHNLEAPRTDVEHDFIAVKIGDLDCSAETRSNVTDSNVTARENNTLVFKTSHQTVSAGTSFDVALQPNQDVNLSAIQFTLDFDPGLATLVSVNSTVLDAQDIAINEKFAQEGQVPFVWYSQQDVYFDTHQSVTLTFEAKRDLDVKDLLDINSSLTKAAAYSSEGIGYKLSLEMLDQLELNSSDKYTLYQNQPNPFQKETVIGFDVSQVEEVKLTVFNIEGKLLYNAEFTAQAGYNSVVISKEELQSTGVLFYQLDAADYTTTKKMIILD